MKIVDNKNYIVAIDLGCSRVKIAAGNMDADGKLNILGEVTQPMNGMVRGEVTNIEHVTASVRGAIDELENQFGIKVDEVYTGISGQDIKCAKSSYFVYISGQDGEIREEDVRKLSESMNNLQPPEGIVILDRIPQKYAIDSREETMQPVGRFGQQLESTFNFILSGKNSVERLQKTFQRLGITCRKMFASGIASAAAVLTEDEKELGAAVVDIGAECTDICIWHDNIMRHVGVIPIGSNAVNRDIRSNAIPDRYIEKLKISHGYAVANNIPEDKKNNIIRLKGRTQRETKEISLYNLAQIIEARMLDIVENVVEEIKDAGYAKKLGSGIVLTGGGALLNDLETLFREHTSYDVRIADAGHILNDASKTPDTTTEASTVIGLLLLGLEESGLPVNMSASHVGSTSDKTHDVETPKNRKNTEESSENDDQPSSDDDREREEKDKKGKGKKKKGFFNRISGIFTDIFDVVDDEEI